MAVYGKQDAIREIREAIARIGYGDRCAIVRLSALMVDAAACAKRKNLTEESVIYWQNVVNRIDDVLNKWLNADVLKERDIERVKRNQERSFKTILCEEA